ncbi:MAG: ABC transporter permease subunit, partial [Anaerolineales bacterium]
QGAIGTDSVAESISKKPPSTFRRVFTYTLVRILTIGITIFLGIFLAVIVANKGGGLDTAFRDTLETQARREIFGEQGSVFSRNERIQQRFIELTDEAGLNAPFLEKYFKYTWKALHLDLGEAIFTHLRTVLAVREQRAGVKYILLSRLPNTLLLVGVAYFFVFVVGIPLSLYLSRNYGSWIDKILNLLSPLSSVPSWVHGVLLVLIFAVTFRLLPPSGMLDNPIPDTPQGIFLSRAKHVILPASAIFLSLLFQLVYTWRNYFMIYSNEDYVEYAVAKGLSNRVIQNKYILQPSMPYVITSFALTLVGFWQMATALEVVFNWDGIGKMYITALPNYFGESFFPGDTNLVIGIVVLFAYILGLVVLLLDFAYALIDPRIRFGGGGGRVRAIRHKRQFQPLAWLSRLKTRKKSGARSRLSLPTQLSIFFGLLVGSLGGVILGWVVWPTTYTDASPDAMYVEFQQDYIQMVVDSFNINQDSGLARLRLEALGENAAPAMLTYMEAVQQDPSLQFAFNNFLATFDASAPISAILNPESEVNSDSSGFLTRIPTEGLLALAGIVVVIGLAWIIIKAPTRKAKAKKLSQATSTDIVEPHQKNSRLKNLLKEMMRYPSAVVGLVILLVMLLGSLYAVIRYPYEEIGVSWYTDASENSKYVPKLASPIWVNFFRKDKLPETIAISSITSPEIKKVSLTSGGNPDYSFTFSIDYPYNVFPQEVKLYFSTEFKEKNPFATVSWITPGGREYYLDNAGLNRSEVYNLKDQIDHRDVEDHQINYQYQESDNSSEPILHSLFADPQATEPKVVPGTYTLQVDVLGFEPDTEVDVELVIMGEVYGFAGTDFMRRDLVVPMLWGMPFALSLGLFGALITTIVSMLLAAFGVWFGGWADTFVQRITEANMILPVVAIAVLFYAFYGASLWAILTIIVVLNALGSPTKTFRAAFLQVKDASYIEAAQAYGAPNRRIIFKYMIPRILPVIIPQLVTLIPGFIFLEATLGMLNVKSN